MLSSCSNDADRICTWVGTCDPPNDFTAVPATPFANRQCTNCTRTCAAGNYVKRNCSDPARIGGLVPAPGNDTVCAACPGGVDASYIGRFQATWGTFKSAPANVSDYPRPARHPFQLSGQLDHAAQSPYDGHPVGEPDDWECQYWRNCSKPSGYVVPAAPGGLRSEAVEGSRPVWTDVEDQQVTDWTRYASTGAFETAAPNTTSDRVCQPATACTLPGEYVSQNLTATTNRQCTGHRTQCLAGHEFTAAPVLYSARQCISCVDNLTYRPDTTGATCLPVRTCALPDATTAVTLASTGEFETRAPNIARNRVCRASTPCVPPAQFVVTNLTATTDRACGSHSTNCPLGFEFESNPDINAARQCRSCVANSTYRPDRTGDPCLPVRTCAAVDTSSAATAASSGEFEVEAPTISRNRRCAASTRCTLPLEFVLVNITATTDRVCGAHPTACPLGFEFVAPPEIAAERQCQSCTFNATFRPDVSGNPCTPVTVCTDASTGTPVELATTGTFQDRAPTISSDRNCAASTTCGLNAPSYVGARYISANLTSTTDRQCQPHPVSCPACGQEWAALPTLIRPRECRDCVLGATFWNRALGDNERLYTCRPIRPQCSPGEVETRAATRCQNRYVIPSCTMHRSRAHPSSIAFVCARV